MPDPNHMDIDQIFLKPPPSFGGGGAAKCSPFELSLINTGTAANPKYFIKVGAGTINNVLNPNWDEGIPVSRSQIENSEQIYIFAYVLFTLGQASSVTYSSATSLPPLSVMDPTSSNGLPTGIAVLIGVWAGNTGCSVYSTSFSLVGYEAFRLYNPANTDEVVYEPYYKFKIGT
jgi:hypothetical protein